MPFEALAAVASGMVMTANPERRAKATRSLGKRFMIFTNVLRACPAFQRYRSDVDFLGMHVNFRVK
jgi:hypothetical protein